MLYICIFISFIIRNTLKCSFYYINTYIQDNHNCNNQNNNNNSNNNGFRLELFDAYTTPMFVCMCPYVYIYVFRSFS